METMHFHCTATSLDDIAEQIAAWRSRAQARHDLSQSIKKREYFKGEIDALEAVLRLLNTTEIVAPPAPPQPGEEGIS